MVGGGGWEGDVSVFFVALGFVTGKRFTGSCTSRLESVQWLQI